MDNLELVDLFWSRFDSGDFFSAKELLKDDLTVIWPASREKFKNSTDFIAMNIEFPGRWNFQKHKTSYISENQVLSVVHVHSKDAEEQFYATSIVTLTDGQISSIETYWAQFGNQPEWRKEFSICY